MIVTKCEYAEDENKFTTDWQGQGTYPVVFDVWVDEFAAGPAIILAGQAVSGPGFDRIFLPNEVYVLGGYTDQNSLMDHYEGTLMDVKDSIFRWKITCMFKPLDPGTSKAKKQEPNPLLWPVEYNVEKLEEQVPLEKATCKTDLPQIRRGPSFPSNEPGPIMNAAAQQTIDPVMRTRYSSIAVAVKNYASLQEIINLNNTYEDTMSSAPFLGVPATCWKYLTTQAQGIQYKDVPGAGLIAYYPGITKIQLRREGWNRLILNNGLICLKFKPVVPGLAGAYYTDFDFPTTYPSPTGSLIHFPCMVKKSVTDATLVEAAEPVNLAIDGTQLPPESQGVYIEYEHLERVDYNNMGLF